MSIVCKIHFTCVASSSEIGNALVSLHTATNLMKIMLDSNVSLFSVSILNKQQNDFNDQHFLSAL